MKKNGNGCVYFAVFLTLIVAMVFFLGCAEFGAFEDQGFNAKTEQKVLRDCVQYLNKEYKTYRYKINNTSIVDYYGTYNGSIVVKVELPGIHHQMVTSYCFFGIEIIEGHGGLRILVWKSGSVYHLTNAYNKGLLTQTDIQSIAEGKNGNTEHCEGYCVGGNFCSCIECECKIN